MRKKEGFEGQRSYILPEPLLQEVEKHPLCQGLLITDIGYYPKARFHNRERRKGSRQHVLIYCIQGEGWYQVQDQKYSVKPNQLFILPAHLSHKYGSFNQNPWTIYWLHFTGWHASSFLEYLYNNDNYSPLTVVPNEERFRLFEDIYSHLIMSFNLDNIIYANNCLYPFLVSFRESVYKHAIREEQGDVVQQSIEFMKGHLDQKFTLQQLAEQVGLSASHYSAIFRQKTQNSPVNFFMFLKIQWSCQLLENTNLRVKEIAHQIGFDDPYHFSRVFSQFIGLSPQQFRTTEKA
ncbi:AraC family transcriptional regulator [Rhodocytophaga aerolata]|uniref:AraC family transcriptional regulator n=1 Tax=Rhodocytophaga aerolata TaxID=455078 RepID=A0ABT8RB07_9BACT|nr:AraC family transcriptional regulator [Rhodocytophaga aerolata]MDO1449286.1 AraC family transcriptional regulator [Rhodocytophaga aerolata]